MGVGLSVGVCGCGCVIVCAGAGVCVGGESSSTAHLTCGCLANWGLAHSLLVLVPS